MHLELRQIAAIVVGALSGPGADRVVTGVSTDSRTLQPGELFVPLRGERYDGHDYLLQAVQQGAVALLSEEVVAGLPVPVIRVADTLRALGDLAGAVRASFGGPVAAITGSAGKTTTKEMLAAILEQDGPGLKTQGNFNNLIGLPLTLFRLLPEHRWAVLEMGTSALGEIARLAEIARPDVGIITNIGSAHLQTLHSLDGVARAKGELFAALRGGTAVINADDPRVRELPVANGVRRLLYGLAPTAAVRAEEIVTAIGEVRFRLQLEGVSAPVRLQTPGRHNVHNALAAAAAAHALGVSPAAIVAGLENFRPVAGRMEVYRLPGGGVLLNDSYNANPLSMEAALMALDDLAAGGQRIAVLGDMLELGPEADELHRSIGRKAARYTDRLLVLGEHAAQVAAGAVEGGLAPSAVQQVADHAAAAAAVLALYCPGDRILLKGSRRLRLEEVAKQLLPLLSTGAEG